MLENCFPKNGEKVPKIRFSGFTGDWEQRKLGENERITLAERLLECREEYITDRQRFLLNMQEWTISNREAICSKITNDKRNYLLSQGKFGIPYLPFFGNTWKGLEIKLA